MSKTAVGTGDSRVDWVFEQIKKMGADELRALNETYCAELGLALLAPPKPDVQAEDPWVEASTHCDVILLGYDPYLKSSTIKIVRDVSTTLGLKEAKDLVEEAGEIRDGSISLKGRPVRIAYVLLRNEAEALKNRLEEIGAQVELYDAVEGIFSLPEKYRIQANIILEGFTRFASEKSVTEALITHCQMYSRNAEYCVNRVVESGVGEIVAYDVILSVAEGVRNKLEEAGAQISLQKHGL